MSLEKVALVIAEGETGIEWKRTGFAKALLSLGDYEEGIGRLAVEAMQRRIPDAYFVDIEARVFSVLEIEDTSKLKREKLFMYAECWFCFDCEDDWLFELLVADRYGMNRRKIPLYFVYLAMIKERRIESEGGRQ